MLLTTTDLWQFAGFNLIVKHYKQSKEQDANTTLVSFLKEHYIDSFKKDKDWQEDASLPFKHSMNLTKSISFCNTEKLIIIPVTAYYELIIPGKFIIKNDKEFTSNFLPNFWHPPKYCV